MRRSEARWVETVDGVKYVAELDRDGSKHLLSVEVYNSGTVSKVEIQSDDIQFIPLLSNISHFLSRFI